MLATKQNGFTLIEVIFGIVLIAIVLTIVTGMVVPQARQSAEPVIQIKANELGQAMMNEILGRSFDERSERSPPFRRCGQSNFSDSSGDPVQCTEITSLGSDGSELRAEFDDVDDFIGTYVDSSLIDNTGTDRVLENSIGTDISGDYPGFRIIVQVGYDNDLDGTFDTVFNAPPNYKLIIVRVIAPNNEEYGFSAYRGNY